MRNIGELFGCVGVYVGFQGFQAVSGTEVGRFSVKDRVVVAKHRRVFDV